MASPLEGVLARLLEPDNDVIQKATLELKEAFKDPTTLQNLCQILGTSTQPQIRQYAAVLIRRKIHKSKQWAALDESIKNSIRENILHLVVQEQNKSARTAIAQIVGVVARHDIPNNQWPMLFDFLVTYIKDEDPAKREAGMFILSSVTSVAAEQMKPHMVSLLELLGLALSDRANVEVAYLSIKCMTDLIFYIGDDEMKMLQAAVPRVLEVVQELAGVDEDKACVALEFFDEMLESEVAIIVPHLKPSVEYCLKMASTKELTDALRVKAMSFISSLVRLKKKTVMKHHLVDPILNVLFPIICEDEEEEDEDEEEVESHRPPQVAVQVIDTMALHLPAEKFIKKLTPMVDTCLKSSEAPHRRAAYLVLAVIVEGCGDFIMTKLLSTMLHTVCQGMNDPSPMVRNAALFAVGQFSEHLQPDISNYAPELLPLLFQYLNKSMEEVDKNPKGVIKSHYALEMFCENLGKGILPYLPALMEYLLNVLKNSPHNKPKELAISAIGAAANAAQQEMQPYFKDILELFKGYLSTTSEEEEIKKLQVAAIDSLAVIARSIGEATFRPLSQECIELGLNLLSTSTDPDLRRCVYGLFAAISVILKGEMAPYLERIVTYMISSMKSTEGIKAHFKDESESVTVFDENEFNDDENLASDDDDEENYKLEGISVENAYLDEKEDACCVLGELALNSGVVFLPFLQQSYTEVMDLVNYPAGGVKKGAFSALCQFCLCVGEACKQTQSNEAAEALRTMLLGAVPKYLESVKTDIDRTVVMSAVDCLQEILAKVGEPVLTITGATDAILSAMKEIFTHKVACQDQEEDGEDDGEAEFDGMLIESAGDVLPVMARLMGGENFLPFFTSFVTDLLKRLKETSSTAEKSFAVGTLAEVIEACGPPVGATFVDTLYPVFNRMMKDEDEEVRSNSVFALGVLAINGGDKMLGYYSDILKSLFALMNGEPNPRVLDNVCAAVCRMMYHSPAHVPVPQVLPVVMQLLPLKEDLEEYVTVFTCLIKLYTDNVQEVIQFIPKILSVVTLVGTADNVKPDVQVMLVQFVQSVKEKFPAEFDQVKSGLEPEQGAILDRCLTLNPEAVLNKCETINPNAAPSPCCSQGKCSR